MIYPANLTSFASPGVNSRLKKQNEAALLREVLLEVVAVGFHALDCYRLLSLSGRASLLAEGDGGGAARLQAMPQQAAGIKAAAGCTQSKGCGWIFIRKAGFLAETGLCVQRPLLR